MKTGRLLLHLDDTLAIVVILKLETQGRAKMTEWSTKKSTNIHQSPRERLQQVPAGRALRSLSPRPSPADASTVSDANHSSLNIRKFRESWSGRASLVEEVAVFSVQCRAEDARSRGFDPVVGGPEVAAW